MATTRRDFLLGTGAGALTLAGGSPAIARGLFAPMAPGYTPKHAPALVVIYLRGGSDWLNMMPPYKDEEYYAVRPTISIPYDDVVPLDSKFGLHPALAPLAPLFEQELFAPVLCTGSPHPTRSHFDAQDFMERGAPGIRTVYSGWLNRYLEVTHTKDSSDFRAVGMQSLLPRSLRGEYPVLAVPENLDRRRGSQTLSRFEEFYGEGAMPGKDPEPGEGGEMEGETMKKRRDEEADKVIQSGAVTIETLRKFQAILVKARANKAAGYPNTTFGSRMRGIAQVIQADEGLEVAAVDYNGWDDHINEGGMEGRHANRLADYAQSVAAFCKQLGDRMQNTLVLTMTEFGRTVRENGNNGTDHGRGSGMFLIGGGVKGGEIHGEWRGLDKKVLAMGRDLPVTTDFRDVMNASLEALFGFKTPKEFFPEYRPGKTKFF